MTTISLFANDQLLSVALNPKLASGDVKSVTLHVDFSAEWNGFARSAVFFTSNDETVFEKVLVSNECTIPAEVLAESGILYIGVRGVDSETNSVKTSTLVKYKVEEGAPAGTGTEVEPTASVYQQLLTAYALEHARINQIISLKDGSTTGDAELADIRVGYDGTTYDTAGDAVRAAARTAKDVLEGVISDYGLIGSLDDFLVIAQILHFGDSKFQTFEVYGDGGIIDGLPNGTYLATKGVCTENGDARYLTAIDLATGLCYKIELLYNDKFTKYYAIVSGADMSIYYGEYFNITDDGEISVKPQLASFVPSNLIIPDVVNEIAVNKLSAGMFKDNKQIVSVTFPDTIDEIPDECFNEAVNLRYLHNTEHIKKIGTEAFRFTRIEKAVFPNLEEFTGIKTFSNVPYLAYADVGKVTTIPDKTFKYCYYLSKIVGTNVTTVGSEAFMGTTRLVNVDFVGNLTSVADYAFWQTKFDYDWSTVSGLSTNATYAQVNPTDFWSNLTPTPCENPTPTEFCQYDERWVNREYGAINSETGNPRIYQNGCMQFCALHIYSGLKRRKFDTVVDFEDIIKTYETTENPLLSIQNGTFNKAITLLNGIELYTRLHSNWDVHELATLYNTLSHNGYAIVNIGAPDGHVVVVYGISNKGELLVLDSERRYPYDETKPARYKLPFNKLIAHTEPFVTVPSRYMEDVYANIDFVDTTTDAGRIYFLYSWYCLNKIDFCEFLKAGILAVNKDNYIYDYNSDSDNLYAGTTDSNVYERNPSVTENENDNKWSWFKSNVPSGQTWVAKAYVQYKRFDGTIVTVYSPIVEVTKQ